MMTAWKFLEKNIKTNCTLPSELSVCQLITRRLSHLLEIYFLGVLKLGDSLEIYISEMKRVEFNAGNHY